MLKLNCFNILVLNPLLTINNIYNKSAYPLFETDELPGFGKFYIQFWWMLMVEDFCFYWMHRFFHTKWIYPYVHKVHHESKQTIAISSIGTHPIEYVLGNAIPVTMGLLLLPNTIHITTFCQFLIIRVFETVDGHSGYEFPFSPYRVLPWGGTSNFHNFHHLVNIGNYGDQFVIWDAIFGTGKTYFDQIEKELVNKVPGCISKVKCEG